MYQVIFIENFCFEIYYTKKKKLQLNFCLRQKKKEAMKPISNERPGVLVLEKYSHCGIAWDSDGEMRLLKSGNSQSSHRWHHLS